MLDLFLASSVTAAVVRSWKPWSDAEGICCAPLVILMGWSCCTAPLTLVLFCNCVFVGFLIRPLLGSFSSGLFRLSVCFSYSLNLHLTVVEHLQERLLSWICIHARYDSVFFLKIVIIFKLVCIWDCYLFYLLWTESCPSTNLKLLPVRWSIQTSYTNEWVFTFALEISCSLVCLLIEGLLLLSFEQDSVQMSHLLSSPSF